MEMNLLLERIGATVRVEEVNQLEKKDAASKLALLGELVNGMVTTVPFEQLDVALGRGIDIEKEVVAEKIVRQGRGGYCFEVNSLFGELLKALGFTVQRCVARVLINGSTGSHTHLVNVVTIEEEELYLVDVGFGGFSPRKPIRMALAKQRQPQLAYPDVFRLVEDDTNEYYDDDHGFVLQVFESMKFESGKDLEQHWKNMYTFSLKNKVFDSDLVMANYFVSTKLTNNWFTNTRLAVVQTEKGRKILQANKFTVVERKTDCDLLELFPDREFSNVDQEGPILSRVSEEIPQEKYFAFLKSEFGIDLSWDHRTKERGNVPMKMDDFMPSARANDWQMF